MEQELGREPYDDEVGNLTAVVERMDRREGQERRTVLRSTPDRRAPLPVVRLGNRSHEEWVRDFRSKPWHRV